METRKIEDCFDGSSVYRYFFDSPWTRECISRLEALGPVDYFPDFPRPFFRLRAESGLQAKGVEGETSCQTVFPKALRNEIQQEFETLVEGDDTTRD